MSNRSIELRDGGRIPIIGFGTWQIQGPDAYRSVRTALEVGYRHIDTATVYGNEQEIGRAVVDSGIAREEIFITTKVPPDGKKSIDDVLAASLRALQCDYVDLWLIHWPPDRGSSLSIWQSMITAQSEGKARGLGVSNFDDVQIDELIDSTGTVPSVNQIRWSPFLHKPRIVESLHSRGIVLEGYSPIKASRLGNEVIVEIARRHEVTPAQVVLRWHIEHNFVVIPKSVQPARIVENYDLFNFVLDIGEIHDLDSLSSI